MLRAVVLTQYRRVTDEIAVASTALAMRALQRPVKTSKAQLVFLSFYFYCFIIYLINKHIQNKYNCCLSVTLNYSLK